MNLKNLGQNGVTQLVNVSAVCGPRQLRDHFDAPGRKSLHIPPATMERPSGASVGSLDARWMLERYGGVTTRRGDSGLRFIIGDGGPNDQEVMALVKAQADYFAAVRKKDMPAALKARGTATRSDFIPHEPMSMSGAVARAPDRPSSKWTPKEVETWASLNRVRLGSDWLDAKKLEHIQGAYDLLAERNDPVMPLPREDATWSAMPA